MHIRRLLHALAATAALLGGAGAMAAPYATTYTGTVANSGIPAEVPDGAVFTLTLVFDNGGTTAASQSWTIGQLTCGFWRWNSVAVALDMGGGVARGAGTTTTHAAGALTGVFSDVNTNGPLAVADYGVSGLPVAPGDSIGWNADGGPLVFGLMMGGGGGSFDDGSGTLAGGIEMAASRWSAPQPFTGACDASAVPPPIPPAAAATPVPTLGPWGALLLAALLGLEAPRRRV